MRLQAAMALSAVLFIMAGCGQQGDGTSIKASKSDEAINHFVASQHWLAYICDYWYAIMHFLVTIAVGVWIYWKHPEWARQLRTSAVCGNEPIVVVGKVGSANSLR